MKCPNCHSVIYADTAWKSSSSRFYCSEFCADIETHDAASSSRVSKDAIDRQYIERLQRLLPYVRRGAAAPLGSDSPGIG